MPHISCTCRALNCRAGVCKYSARIHVVTSRMALMVVAFCYETSRADRAEVVKVKRALTNGTQRRQHERPTSPQFVSGALGLSRESRVPIRCRSHAKRGGSII